MQIAHHFLVLAGPARWAPWPAWGRRRATRLLRGAHPGVKGLARDSESGGDHFERIETLAGLPRSFRRSYSANCLQTMALLALGLPDYSGRGGSTGHPQNVKRFLPVCISQRVTFPLKTVIPAIPRGHAVHSPS